LLGRLHHRFGAFGFGLSQSGFHRRPVRPHLGRHGAAVGRAGVPVGAQAPLRQGDQFRVRPAPV
jgi:hypothetical protein